MSVDREKCKSILTIWQTEDGRIFVERNKDNINGLNCSPSIVAIMGFSLLNDVLNYLDDKHQMEYLNEYKKVYENLLEDGYSYGELEKIE